jgi:FixJ family two-component response regulator
VQYIAIIDDHAGLREAIAALLDSAGYPSRGFESAEDFLHSRETGQAACLVLDERLPGGIDGLELQGELARAGRRMPIVFISAHADADASVPERALQEGALAFLRKPFDDVEFLDVVGRAWRAGGTGYT